MRRFSFNLEKLLIIREHEEKEWEIRLGKAVSNCVNIEMAIKDRHKEIKKIIGLSANNVENNNYLLSANIYRNRMEQEIIGLEEELKKAKEERDEIKADYLEASKKRKVLYKLKEKREREYYKAQRKIEFNEIDEMNNARAASTIVSE